MPEITIDLIRRKAEHNEGLINTLEELSLHQVSHHWPATRKRHARAVADYMLCWRCTAFGSCFYDSVLYILVVSQQCLADKIHEVDASLLVQA